MSISSMILLFSCSTNDENAEILSYSDKQEKAFALFNGTWADIQFSNLSDGHLSELKQDPDKIVFGMHNNTPIEVYANDYMNGKTLLFNNQGECTYYNMPYKDASYEVVECYYQISINADYLTLYKKSDNSLYRRYDMSIKSETKINLQDPNISLPYIFVKQSDDEQQESYYPISVYLTKEEWKNGEEINLYIYPPTNESLPQQYSYISSVEYLIDGKSVGKSSVKPFSISYMPNLTLGKHEISIKISLNKENVVWETTVKSFTIIE